MLAPAWGQLLRSVIPSIMPRPMHGRLELTAGLIAASGEGLSENQINWPHAAAKQHSLQQQARNLQDDVPMLADARHSASVLLCCLPDFDRARQCFTLCCSTFCWSSTQESTMVINTLSGGTGGPQHRRLADCNVIPPLCLVSSCTGPAGRCCHPAHSLRCVIL